jgi:hypothetical protein
MFFIVISLHVLKKIYIILKKYLFFLYNFNDLFIIKKVIIIDIKGWEIKLLSLFLLYIYLIFTKFTKDLFSNQNIFK